MKVKAWQWIAGGVLAAALVGVGTFAGVQAQALETYRGELDVYKERIGRGIQARMVGGRGAPEQPRRSSWRS